MSESIRTLYMGTPEFAVPALRKLAMMPFIDLVAVVTRLDKPIGRSRTPESPPVKVAAQSLAIPVVQPGSFKKAVAVATIAALQPELIIVAAFGQILPAAILDLPRYGCLNIHASLLPKYRGASPITSALLNGDAITGNTIMLMDVGLDTGAMIVQESLLIATTDTTATLTAKLAEQGADLLQRMLPDWIAGVLTPQLQDEDKATATRLIRKEDGMIDWKNSAAMIDRQVRAYTPWPGTQTIWNGQPLKIIAAHVANPLDFGPDPLPVGQIVATGRGNQMQVGIGCGEATVLVLDMLQLPGKRALPAADVVRGYPALNNSELPS